MRTVAHVLGLLCWLFAVLLFIRLICEWIQAFVRGWKPRGLVLVIAELAYTLTDPPLKALRKLLPPLRIGRTAIDLSFMLVLMAAMLAANILDRV